MSFVTGPTALPKTTDQALQERLEALEARCAALEANRQPAPLRLYQLLDTGPMSQAASGDTVRYDQPSGLWFPGP